ncbi:PAS domain S-box protein [Granulosicoccus sp. 3-233]|uniref:PAS domain S-box protein n=1 Tax=Granulosicoccus sp. 3-233 TaxID=3417969 RepID=UPI003D342455
MKDKWSLNTVIPLLVLGAGFILLSFYLSISYSYQKSQFRQLSEQRLAYMGPRLTDITQRMLALGEDGLLDAEMESMRHMPDVSLVVVVDEANTILYSSDVELRGSRLESSELHRAAVLIEESGGIANRVQSQSDGARQMLGVFAFSAPAGQAGSEVPVAGHVAISIDLEESYKRLLVTLWSQALLVALLLTVVAGLLWYLLHQVVVKPLRKLVGTTRAIAAGDYTARTNLASSNELGEIAATLDSLALSCLEQAEIQDTHRRLSRLVEDMVDEVIVCDMSTLEIINTNRAAQKNLGYSADELSTMMPWQFVTHHTKQSMLEMIQPLLQGSSSHIDCECRHTRKDGTGYPVRARMQLMEHQSPPVLVTIAQDLSELQTQIESAQLRERALAAVSEGIIIANAGKPGRTIVYVNQAVCDMSGYSAEELLGQSTDFLRKNAMNQPDLLSVRHALENAKPVNVILDATRKDGSNYKTEVSISPVLNAAGEMTHYIGLHRDITQRLLAEEKLHQAQKIKAIGQLSGGLAHDFNNLLSVIVGNLELLRTGVKDSAQMARIKGAENAAHMGAHLTRRLLSFASQQRLVPSVTNVNDHVHNAMALLAPTIGETITLQEELEDNLWQTLTDPGEIETAVINLTINARDAMSQGGSITIFTSNVVLDGEVIGREQLDLEPGEYVRLCVMDNGPGISESIQGRIFEPFFTTKPEGEGGGLGLASVFGFAKQSGGCVKVKSTEGGGTRVSVYLPRHIPQSSPSSLPDSVVEDTCRCFSDSRILVVEDKETVRDLTVQQLQTLGFQTLAVEDGIKALELLQSRHDLDIVLSDVVMPGGVSGYDVADWVQTNRPECRVLMTSGFSGPADSENRPGGGDLHVLQKPYRLDDLRKALHDALGCSV